MADEEDDKKGKKKKGKKKSDKKRGSGLLIFGMIVGSIVMIIFLQMTFVLFVVGVLPSFVAYYIDRSPSRSTFHTVMPCNLAGVLPFIAALAAEGNDSTMLQMMLSDLTVLLIMYVAAGVGWALVYASPHVAAIIINSLNGRQILRLKQTQDKLLNEWGEDVRRIDVEY